MKVGDYYKTAVSKSWYHKIVGEEGKKFLVLDITFPVQGVIKVTKSVVEYACKQVTEKEVLDWIIKQIMKENQISLQDKIDEVTFLLNDIKKEVKKYRSDKDGMETTECNSLSK